jgi:16S rRNA (cytidine1402-2'-O)-methyltransferase
VDDGSDLDNRVGEPRAKDNVIESATGGRLTVVATPIGNLSDISPRARATLRDADLIACEDTRRTGVLLKALDLKVPLVSLHAHNEAARLPELLMRLRDGARVAIVSDAGMPGVSDPGARLVDAAHAAGFPVEVIPGPSAVTAAIAASGAPADRFAFAGFWPRKAGERTALLADLDRLGWPVIGFESPQRLAGLLADVATADPERRVAVCRELSKLYEETLVGTASELAARFAAAPPRGEITLVLWPRNDTGRAAADAAHLQDVVATLLEAGLSPARAADLAAKIGAGARNAAYRTALAEARRRNT